MRTFFILYNYFFKNVTNILLKRLSIALNVMYIFFECYDFFILNYTNILLHCITFLKSVTYTLCPRVSYRTLQIIHSIWGSCSEDAIEVIKNVLGVTSSDFEEKYLGLPTPDGRLRVSFKVCKLS